MKAYINSVRPKIVSIRFRAANHTVEIQELTNMKKKIQLCFINYD